MCTANQFAHKGDFISYRSNGNFPRNFVAKVGLVTLELENGIPAGAGVCNIEEYSFQLKPQTFEKKSPLSLFMKKNPCEPI